MRALRFCAAQKQDCVTAHIRLALDLAGQARQALDPHASVRVMR